MSAEETKRKISDFFNGKFMNVFRYILIFFFSLLTVYYVCKGEQELFQVPKDLGFYRGCFFFCILIFVIRKISIKKIEVWISLILGIIGLLVFFKVKNISPMTYGVDYYRVILYSRITCVISFALFVDLIRNNGKLFAQKVNWFGIALILALIFAVINKKKDIVPIIFPMLAFYTTVIDEDEWKRIADIFVISYYIVFVYWCIRSYLYFPDKYSVGRFIGAFLREDTAGPVCAGAIISGLYFIGRWLFSERKKWYTLFASVLLSVFPVYITLKIGSRSSFLGLLFASAIFLVFIAGRKGKKYILIRAGIAIGVVAILTGLVIAIAAVSSKQMDNGTYDSKKHGYVYNHISVLVNSKYRSGYFGDDSILNAIDTFSSERLKIWDASLKIVEPFGKPYNGIYIEWNDWGGCSTAHSTFVEMLVEYGGIGGSIVLLCYLLTMILAAVQCIKRNKNAILPLLWFAFCIGPMGGNSLYWTATVTFSLLMFWYPILFFKKYAEDKDK